jgi:alkylated DNA repair dioxygenase AlkB
LNEIKNKVEQISKEKFNSCLLNLYHDGNEGMGWHSDDEKMIVPKSAIASVSFGAQRKFVFKHKKDKTQVSTILENGSLLVMKGETQIEWLHALPKSLKIKAARINLTFRMIVE